MIRTFTYAQNVKIFTVGEGEETQHIGSLQMKIIENFDYEEKLFDIVEIRDGL